MSLACAGEAMGKEGMGSPGRQPARCSPPAPPLQGSARRRVSIAVIPKQLLVRTRAGGDGQVCALLLDLCPQAWGYRGSGFPTDAPTFGAQPGASPDSRAALAGELEREGAQRRPSTQR